MLHYFENINDRNLWCLLALLFLMFLLGWITRHFFGVTKYKKLLAECKEECKRLDDDYTNVQNNLNTNSIANLDLESKESDLSSKESSLRKKESELDERLNSLVLRENELNLNEKDLIARKLDFANEISSGKSSSSKSTSLSIDATKSNEKSSSSKSNNLSENEASKASSSTSIIESNDITDKFSTEKSNSSNTKESSKSIDISAEEVSNKITSSSKSEVKIDKKSSDILDHNPSEKLSSTSEQNKITKSIDISDSFSSFNNDSTSASSNDSQPNNGLNFASFGTATEAEKDDLKKISGVGPFIENKLNSIGIYTFSQISKFTEEDINKVTELIEFFPGRIKRDNWVNQASILKSGASTEFSKRVDNKDVDYNKDEDERYS